MNFNYTTVQLLAQTECRTEVEHSAGFERSFIEECLFDRLAV